jgi:ribonuclease HI
MKKVTIYTDGACQGNPGPGGWAAVLIHGHSRRELAGSCPATTNNRMELTAAIEALRTLKEACRVDLHTDSVYLQQGMNSWLANWKARGWKTASKKPVKNRDLWQALDREAKRHEMHWHWVKAHNLHPENERCDQLAVKAIEDLRAEIGEQGIARAMRGFSTHRADTGFFSRND